MELINSYLYDMNSDKMENSLDEVFDIIWNELPSELKQALKISIAQSERGEVSPHNEVMADIKKRYNIK